MLSNLFIIILLGILAYIIWKFIYCQDEENNINAENVEDPHKEKETPTKHKSKKDVHTGERQKQNDEISPSDVKSEVESEEENKESPIKIPDAESLDSSISLSDIKSA